jgi:hypothetical protein
MEIVSARALRSIKQTREKLFDSPKIMPAEDMDAKTIMVADSKRRAPLSRHHHPTIIMMGANILNFQAACRREWKLEA